MPTNQTQRPDSIHKQNPGWRGNADQAQEYINEYQWRNDDPAEEAGTPEVERKRADVPVGPSDHDKLVPSDVAQGD